MSTALLCSALANLVFGSVDGFVLFAVLWGLNGWFQSIGSAPSVVSICQWFSNRERGTRYGIWAGAHNLGEGMTFIGRSFCFRFCPIGRRPTDCHTFPSTVRMTLPASPQKLLLEHSS
jgi:sugar phosphate permease